MVCVMTSPPAANAPRVTAIIIVFNGEAFIDEAIEKPHVRRPL